MKLGKKIPYKDKQYNAINEILHKAFENPNFLRRMNIMLYSVKADTVVNKVIDELAGNHINIDVICNNATELENYENSDYVTVASYTDYLYEYDTEDILDKYKILKSHYVNVIALVDSNDNDLVYAIGLKVPNKTAYTVNTQYLHDIVYIPLYDVDTSPLGLIEDSFDCFYIDPIFINTEDENLQLYRGVHRELFINEKEYPLNGLKGFFYLKNVYLTNLLTGMQESYLFFDASEAYGDVLLHYDLLELEKKLLKKYRCDVNNNSQEEIIDILKSNDVSIGFYYSCPYCDNFKVIISSSVGGYFSQDIFNVKCQECGNDICIRMNDRKYRPMRPTQEEFEASGLYALYKDKYKTVDEYLRKTILPIEDNGEKVQIIMAFIDSKYYTNYNDRTILNYIANFDSVLDKIVFVTSPSLLHNSITYSTFQIEAGAKHAFKFRCDKLRDDVIDNMSVMDILSFFLKEYDEIALCLKYEDIIMSEDQVQEYMKTIQEQLMKEESI